MRHLVWKPLAKLISMIDLQRYAEYIDEGMKKLTADIGNQLTELEDSASLAKESFSFFYDDIAAGLTDVDLASSAAGHTEYIVNYAANIVAIGVTLTAARSTGYARFYPVKNGSGDSQYVECTSGATNNQYEVLATPISLAAGDRIGVHVTTTVTWAPVTSDATVTLTIEYT